MRTLSVAIFTAAALLLSGCASPSLVQDLRLYGLTCLNTKKVVIRPSEGGFGAGITVYADRQYIIQKIWDKIYQATPDSPWVTADCRQIEFYTSHDASTPLVTLQVNGKDQTHIKGKTQKEGFTCPGLYDYLTPLLRRAYENRAKDSS